MKKKRISSVERKEVKKGKVTQPLQGGICERKDRMKEGRKEKKKINK